MKWILVAVSVTIVLRSSSGAAIPGAIPHDSDATTLVHAGHHADVVLTDQGFELTRVKKQTQDEIAPVLIQYNANIPSAEDQRVRRQLQQQGNATGEPTVQFFTDAGSFNREIQRLFSIVQGTTPTGVTAATDATSVRSNTPAVGESNLQTSADLPNAKVATSSAVATQTSLATSSAAPRDFSNLNTNEGGISLAEVNQLIDLERSNNINTLNAGINTASNDFTLNSNNILETLGKPNLEGSSFTDHSVSSLSSPFQFITNFPTQALDATSIITNFGNAATSGTAGTGVQNSEANFPVILISPNEFKSLFRLDNTTGVLNNQVNARTTNLDINNDQNNNIAKEGVASAGIRRLKERIRNPTNQSPRDIFLDELAKSGISNPLQGTLGKSDPNNVRTQSLANVGGGNQLNVEQNLVNVNNQRQTSNAVALQSPQTRLSGQSLRIGSNQNQFRLPSQHQIQNIGQLNANHASQANVLRANQNRIFIPVRFLNAFSNENTAFKPKVDISDPNNFRAHGFANVGGKNPVNEVQNPGKVNNQENNELTSQRQTPNFGHINTNHNSQGTNFISNQNRFATPVSFPNVNVGVNQNLITTHVASPNVLSNGNQAGNLLFNQGNIERQTLTTFIGAPRIEQAQLRGTSFAGVPQRAPLITNQANFRAQNQPSTSLNQSHRFNNQGQLNNTQVGVSQGNFNQNNQRGRAPFSIGSAANYLRQPKVNNLQGFSSLSSQLNTHSIVNNNPFVSGTFPQVTPTSTSNVRESSSLSPQHNTQSATTPIIGQGGISLFTPKGPPKWGFFSNRFCNPPHRCKVVTDFGTLYPIRT